MKLILTIVSVLLCFHSEAQQYFNKRYDFHQSSLEVAQTIIVDSDFAWITYITTDTLASYGWQKFGVMKIDMQGNILNNRLYGRPFTYFYTGGSSSMDKTEDSNFICAASISDTLQTDAVLYKLDHNCDTIWMRTYGDTAFQSGFMARQTLDGGFALCGQDATSGSFGAHEILLIKTDSVGNLLWQRRYGDSTSAELAYAFTNTSDGGYALVGEKLYTNTVDMYLVKTDSLGNLQWERTFGGSFADRLYSIITTSDGNLVMSGYNAVTLLRFLPYVTKFDLQGNMLWEKNYGDSMRLTALNSIRELPDGSMIVAGEARESISPSPSSGLIIKIASDGDSIWYRRYYSSNPSFQSTHCYLKDIYPTRDGGFVACGIVNPVPPDTGNQDVWILKVDSLGCEVVNCTVGIQNVLQDRIIVKVYPNPFTSFLSVEFEASNDPYIIKLYDVLGKEVRHFSIREKNFLIDAIDLPEGLFLLKIFQKNQPIYSGKIIHLSE